MLLLEVAECKDSIGNMTQKKQAVSPLRYSDKAIIYDMNYKIVLFF